MKTLLERICYHRGIGEENTLTALREALKKSPFMLEFDVQLYNEALHLGHPPKINKSATLIDALKLYPEITMPKVDMKLRPESADIAVDMLKKIANEYKKPILVNLGDIGGKASLDIERKFCSNLAENVMLNIDLARYADLEMPEIETHVESIKDTIMSISPNLKDDITPVIKLAKKYNIPHIHFWALENDIYEEAHLNELVNDVSKQRLEVYFDIAISNVSY